MQQVCWASLGAEYYSKHLSVVPIIGKRPPINDWAKYSTELNSSLFTCHNQTGIGLVCGEASDIVAIDIDTDDALILKTMPPSPVVKRGKKGETRFFRFKKGIVSRSFPYIKIDIIGPGRQTVLPPSVHPETLRSYQWLSFSLLDFDLDLLPVFDLSLISRLELSEETAKKEYEKTNSGKPVGGRHDALMNQGFAALNKGKSIEETAQELFEYDLRVHSPPWVYDDLGAKTEQDAINKLVKFVSGLEKTINKNHETIISEAKENIAAFSLQKYPKPVGALGIIQDYISSTSYTDTPNLAFGSSISIFSALLGNQVVFEGVKSNLFSLLIAPSGSGKSFGPKAAESLLPDKIGSADYLSSVAISSNIDDFIETLNLSVEFSKTMKLSTSVGSQWQASIPQELCKLWDASNGSFLVPNVKKEKIEVKEGEKEPKPKKSLIECPFVSILAATTNNEFATSCSRELFTSGLMPRFLIFLDDKPSSIKHFIDSALSSKLKHDSLEVVRIYSSLVKRNALGIPTEKRLSLSKEAKDMFIADMDYLFKKMIDEQNDIAAAYLSRQREYYKKLALIHAMSRSFNSSEVTAQDLVFARSVIDINYHNALPLLGLCNAENKEESNKERVFNIINNCGMLSKRDVARKTQFLSGPLRKMILQDLTDAGRIRYAEKKSDDSRKSKGFYFV